MKRGVFQQQILNKRWSLPIMAIILFMIYVIGRNMIHAIQISFDLARLDREAEMYQERITRDSTVIESLKIDSELERYARENYLLQRPNEEIFIIKGRK